MKPLILVLALVIPGCAGSAGPVAEPLQDSTPAKFDYEFLNYVGGQKPSVLVKIRKSDPDHGVVMWSAVHQVGDTLGWSMEFGIPSSTHLVLSTRKGKAVYADFDTGVVIEKIVVNDIVSKKVRSCPIIWKPMTKCPGSAWTVNADRVDEVYCRERTGAEWVHQRGMVLAREGEVCSAHGGNDVPRWNQKEHKAMFESQAASFLSEADIGWGSRNPKARWKARDLYRRLLDEYEAYEAVIKNGDRIKTRAEAEIED